jgi:regulator of protease activity HflC (stomatin/prohibitin superfamily)
MNFKQQLVAGLFGLIALIGVSTLFGSFYTVDEGERGVELRAGKITGTALPGLNFKLPFVDSVKFIDVKNGAQTFTKLSAYSKDQQTAFMNVSVNFHVDPTQVEEIYAKYGSIEQLLVKTINRQVPQQVENVFGAFNAVKVVQDRQTFVSAVDKAVKDATVGTPLIVDSVQVENIDFSEAYEQAIAARMKAEVEVKTREQNLAMEQIQASINVTKAQAVADSNLAIAKAEASAITLRGNAEAGAIKVRAAALESNANLVELTKAERWDGKLPTTMLPNGAVPFLTK